MPKVPFSNTKGQGQQKTVKVMKCTKHIPHVNRDISMTGFDRGTSKGSVGYKLGWA